MINDKIKTKALVIISALLLCSLLTNGYFLGSGGGDQSEQLKLYEELNRKSNITEGLLTDRIAEAKEDLSTSRKLLDESRAAINTLKELNTRRARLDKINTSLSGKLNKEVITGITSIDSGAGSLTELQRVEQKERQALSNILGTE